MVSLQQPESDAGRNHREFQVLFLYPNIQMCALMPTGIRHPQIRESEPLNELGNQKYEELLKSYQSEQFGAVVPIDS